MLDLYFEHNKVFPKPSKPQEGEILISPPLSFIAKMLLLNTMVLDNIRACDLAKKMNIKRQEVNRILDLKPLTPLRWGYLFCLIEICLSLSIKSKQIFINKNLLKSNYNCLLL